MGAHALPASQGGPGDEVGHLMDIPQLQFPAVGSMRRGRRMLPQSLHRSLQLLTVSHNSHLSPKQVANLLDSLCQIRFTQARFGAGCGKISFLS